jgi:selenocysteine-specific elongation factor
MGHRAELAEADRALLDRVHTHLPLADLRPPIVGELATLLNLPLADLREFLLRMAQRGLLVRVAPNRFYRPETVDALAALARTLAAESADGSYDAAGYRDRSGIGRNLTVQVLEFLDRAGVTRFDGARHRPIA